MCAGRDFRIVFEARPGPISGLAPRHGRGWRLRARCSRAGRLGVRRVVLGYVVDVDHGGDDVGVPHVCLDVGERELPDGEGCRRCGAGRGSVGARSSRLSGPCSSGGGASGGGARSPRGSRRPVRLRCSDHKDHCKIRIKRLLCTPLLPPPPTTTQTSHTQAGDHRQRRDRRAPLDIGK
jgi:hypothetical protein